MLVEGPLANYLAQVRMVVQWPSNVAFGGWDNYPVGSYDYRIHCIIIEGQRSFIPETRLDTATIAIHKFPLPPHLFDGGLVKDDIKKAVYCIQWEVDCFSRLLDFERMIDEQS